MHFIEDEHKRTAAEDIKRQVREYGEISRKYNFKKYLFLIWFVFIKIRGASGKNVGRFRVGGSTRGRECI
jgi:hypothetical protein